SLQTLLVTIQHSVETGTAEIRHALQIEDQQSGFWAFGLLQRRLQLRPQLAGGAGIDLPDVMHQHGLRPNLGVDHQQFHRVTRFDALKSSARDHGYWSRPLDDNAARRGRPPFGRAYLA